MNDKQQQQPEEEPHAARNNTPRRQQAVAADPNADPYQSPVADKNDTGIDMNVIINLSILKSIVEIVGHCPRCKRNTVELSIDPGKKKGLSHEIMLSCSCSWSHTLFSSCKIDQTDSKSSFDVNVRSVIAFREFGQGWQSIETFCRIMNIPPPMTNLTYTETVNKLHPLYLQAAEKSMSDAAAAVIENDDTTNIVASLDGSWQRRGYASLNGVVTCIERGNDKCIDVEVKVKDCKSCVYWEKRKKDPAYLIWKNSHICLINHVGSASSMETLGTVAIFNRSVEKHNLRYTTFIGDGDSSAFATVVEEDPYPGIAVSKGECIGHVQKRVGSNLRKIRKELPKHRRKLIFGKGKLTDAAINYIQNCYGLAIRQNTHSIFQMKKNVGALLIHCSDVKPVEERHKWCPRTEDSWCSYWNVKKNAEMKLNLPASIKDEPEIKHLFERLRDEALLSKCLHGKTQNVNESLNGIIWTRCPKRVYVGRKTLEIGVSSAVLEFNNGKEGIFDVMKRAGLSIGEIQKQSTEKASMRCKRVLVNKSTPVVKRRRKDLRAVKKSGQTKTRKKKRNHMKLVVFSLFFYLIFNQIYAN